jgi:hypothetical protein
MSEVPGKCGTGNTGKLARLADIEYEKTEEEKMRW